ncbi:MAG: hypothetical protein RPS47_03020, partial [Colwellia sp.]
MRSKTILLLLILSGVVFHSTHNPIGIYGAMELYLALTFVMSGWYFIVSINFFGGLKKIDALVLFLPLLLAFISAISAYYSHGQPILYGLIEERRLFLLYSFFAFRLIFLNSVLDFELFVELLFMAGLLTLSIVYFYFFFVGFDLDAYSDRGGRASIGNYMLALTMFSSVALYTSKSAFCLYAWRKIFIVIVFCLCFLALIYIVKVRSLAIVTVLVCVLFYYRSFRSLRGLRGHVAVLFFVFLFALLFVILDGEGVSELYYDQNFLIRVNTTMN